MSWAMVAAGLVVALMAFEGWTWPESTFEPWNEQGWPFDRTVRWCDQSLSVRACWHSPATFTPSVIRAAAVFPGAFGFLEGGARVG